MNPLKAIKNQFKQFRSSEFNRNLQHLTDKHRLIQKALYAGIFINGYLIFSGLQKMTALKQLQEYIEERRNEAKNRYEQERTQILYSLEDDKDRLIR